MSAIIGVRIMKILVCNAGSSSLKYQLIDMSNEKVLVKGLCERINIDGRISQKNINGKQFKKEATMKNHTDAIKLVIQSIIDPEFGVIKDISEIDAVGHRVLHSAEDFNDSVVITDEVLKICEKNVELGPLHMPGNIACIKSCMEILKDKPMVAVFDTTFHSTLPPKAYMYGIKYEDYEKYRVRKYGFHGSSHKFVSSETMKYLKNDKAKLIICHIGNGSSLSAVDSGVCMDTSMGFTPLAGVVMGTRSGDIDPSAVDFLRNKLNLSAEKMVDYLNKECGMLGISGVSSDMRDVENKMFTGDERCTLSIEMIGYTIKKYVGAYLAVLNGADAIVFTGGIGENSDIMRKLVTENMTAFGIEIDEKKNNVKASEITDISGKKSKVKVLIVPTNEELLIARETAEKVAKMAK